MFFRLFLIINVTHFFPSFTLKIVIFPVRDNCPESTRAWRLLSLVTEHKYMFDGQAVGRRLTVGGEEGPITAQKGN